MSSGFHRGGFENAPVVHGDRTLLRPVEEADVDLLLAWHADEEVARYWDHKTFTRATMLLRLARGRVTPFVVEAEGAGLRGWRKAGLVDIETHGAHDEHVAPWVLMEFSRR